MKKLVFILLATLAMASCSKTDDPVATYTVTFDASGGNPTPATQSVKAGDKAVAPANPTKQNYVFLFWSLNGTSAYDFQSTVNNDITLQAKWEDATVAEYWQVSWELSGGSWPSGDNHVTQVVKGGTLTEPADPVKSGNTFDGWYKESALTNKINFPYDVNAVTANFTLYAKWTSGSGGTTDPSGYKMFTSISELKSWLSSQSANTTDTPYKLGLKNVNLDSGSNWADLGVAISGTNKTKYVDLYLKECSSTTIPDGYTEFKGNTMITYGAFVDCSNLISIVLPKGLTTIGKYAFYFCSKLNSIDLPEGLININDYAFHQCSSLYSISLPNGLKKLGTWAFARSGLKSVIIPKSIVDLGTSTFYQSDLKSVTIEEGVETIDEAVFSSCSLESVTLPSSLKTIGQSAFSHCSLLKTINLPQGLITIDQEAFMNCSGLTSITIPNSVISIGSKAFYETKLLNKIIMQSTAPPSLGFKVFYGTYLNINDNLKINVPVASVNAYKTASDWGEYVNKIVALIDWN